MTDSTMRNTTWARGRPLLLVGLVLTALAVSGCSTNMTGFDFPRFGLLKNNAQDDRDALLPDPSGTGTRLTVR